MEEGNASSLYYNMIYTCYRLETLCVSTMIFELRNVSKDTGIDLISIFAYTD